MAEQFQLVLHHRNALSTWEPKVLYFLTQVNAFGVAPEQGVHFMQVMLRDLRDANFIAQYKPDSLLLALTEAGFKFYREFEVYLVLMGWTKNAHESIGQDFWSRTRLPETFLYKDPLGTPHFWAM